MPISRLSLRLALSDSWRLSFGVLSYHAGSLPWDCRSVRKLSLVTRRDHMRRERAAWPPQVLEFSAIPIIPAETPGWCYRGKLYQVLDAQIRDKRIINCFMPLSFGAVYFTANDNWKIMQTWNDKIFGGNLWVCVSLKWNFSPTVDSVLEQENIFLWPAANECLRNYGKLEWFLSISKYTKSGKASLSLVKQQNLYKLNLFCRNPKGKKRSLKV